MCTAECKGQVCDCASFSRLDHRAKPGKSKKQDVLDRWNVSMDAPLRASDEFSGSIGSLLGKRDAKLDDIGNQTEDAINNEMWQEATAQFSRGRCGRVRLNVHRDLEIYNRRMAGETPKHLAPQYGISTTRIIMIVYEVQGYLIRVAMQRLQEAGR